MSDKSKESKLMDNAVIYLSGEISPATSERICTQIIQLNIEGKHPFIQMLIDSPGGSLYATFSIIDMMGWSALPIYTTGIGLIASGALMILMAGSKGHRVLTPSTSIMSHRFGGMSMGNYSDMLAKRAQEDLLHKRAVDLYIRCTKVKTAAEVESKLLKDTDCWLTPEEALKYGICDSIHEGHLKEATRDKAQATR